MIFAALATTAAGCWYSTTADLYGSQLEKVKPGMSKAEVRQIIPDAKPSGGNTVDGQTVEVLQLSHIHMKFLGGMDGVTEQRTWFYFHDDRLVKWGEPDRWPTTTELRLITSTEARQ